MPKLGFALAVALCLAGCGGPKFLPVIEGGERPTLVPLDDILGPADTATAAD